jgi:drug/metabolite transporter (DMT)-like permease
VLKRSFSPYLLLASLSLFWGLNWPGMKIILNEMTVWWFRGICLIVGGTILLSLAAMSGNRWKLRVAELKPVLVCGLFAIMGWMVFSAYGVSLMPAGRASIIAFTMPLWATVMAALLLGEKITLTKIIGLMFGIAGLVVLIGSDLVILQRAPIGSLFMLLAALSWALGTVLIKRFYWEIPVITNVAWQLLFSSIPMLIIAISFEPFPDPSSLSLKALLALIYLFLFPMSFCQWAYFKTVSLLPASVAAIGTLMVPVIGVFSSHLILDEPVGMEDLVALSLILLALIFVLLVPAIRLRHKGRRENIVGS